MNDRHFDHLARRWGARRSRRSVLRGLAAIGVVAPFARGRDSRAAIPIDHRTLLASYNFRHSGSVPYDLTAYRPRQFRRGLVIDDPARGPLRVTRARRYAGWDVLPTINEGVRRIATWPDWLQLRLHRDARLAVVWRGGETTTWLDEWERGDQVEIDGEPLPTFTRSFPAGPVALGGVYNDGEHPLGGRDTYWVLFGEADGRPTPPPPQPRDLDPPVANQPCPAWVHDRYVGIGPDGRPYPIWHHQIHPVYWCYFGHEHGTDPATFTPDYINVFNDVAAVHGMDEPHTGFKNIGFVSDGVRWWLTIHFGTGGLARACTRYHSLEIAVADDATGELLADLRLMADFGGAVVNAGDAPLTPPDCPDQAALADGSFGIRKLPTVDTGAISYEPWRPDFTANVLGLGGVMVVNTPDPMVICNTAACDEAVTTPATGTIRFLDANTLSIRAGERNADVFYTDPLGLALRRPDDPDAIRQFVKPGLDLELDHGDSCRDFDAWGQPFRCGDSADSIPTAREGSIVGPN
jgi:hypothetical protein